MSAAPNDHPLCQRCRQIDLDLVFRAKSLTKRGTPVPGWTSDALVESCSLCRFLIQTYRLKEEDTRRKSPRLRLFSSNRVSNQGWKAVDTTFLALEDHDSPCITRQLVENDPVRVLGRQLDFGLVKEWLDHCGTHHIKTCAATGNRPGLSSILGFDCHTRCIVPGSGLPYVALSYVWGKGSAVLPDADRLPPNLPRTLQDTITVTVALGFRYLWIDRYCIDQKRSEEVHEQVSKMDIIYNNAELTIIAADGDRPEVGLPGVTPRLDWQLTTKIGEVKLITSLRDPRHIIKSSTWATRAWTYQEGLLSRRRLVFTRHQVYFECLGMYCFESLRFPLSNLHIKNGNRFRAEFCNENNLGMFPLQLGRKGWEVVERIEEYTRRDMSKECDILDGFSGILRALEIGPQKIRHCCGVPIIPRPPTPTSPSSIFQEELTRLLENPTIGLCIGLCWSNQKPRKRRNGFPSWSWTGWIGSIDWGLRSLPWKEAWLHTDLQVKFRLRDGKLLGLEEYMTLNPPSSILDALHLSAWVTPIEITSGLIYHVKQSNSDHTSLGLLRPNGVDEELEIEYGMEEYDVGKARDLAPRGRITVDFRYPAAEKGSYILDNFQPTARITNMELKRECLMVELVIKIRLQLLGIIVHQRHDGLFERIGFIDTLRKVEENAGRVWRDIQMV